MKRSSSGFTLIEVLVATTVLSLVLMLTVSAMRMIGSSSSKVITVVDRNDEMRTVSLFIFDAVRRAEGSGSGGVPQFGGLWSQVSKQQGSYFKGEATSVAWLSPQPVGVGRAGRQYLRLSRSGDELLFQSYPYEEDTDPPDWASEAPGLPLINGVSEFKVYYRWVLGEPWADSDSESDEERLPTTIKFRLKVDEKYWPDLVVALDNSASADSPR